MASGATEVFGVALRLGLTSFGGPVAHLGYFRAEYVHRRRWVSEEAYAEIVALAQLLPGPASSQVGMAVGHVRAGLPGAVAGWIGFTLPSALVMAATGAFAVTTDVAGEVWLRALGLVAVAVVLDAVVGMSRALVRSVPTAVVAVLTAATLLVLPTSAVVQVAALAVAAVVGALWRRDAGAAGVPVVLPLRVGRRFGAVALAAFGVLLVALPAARVLGDLGALTDAVYRAGALVFGGGHVVLPLLEAGTVPELVGEQEFLAGYAMAQALPGPLFTFATYLGQVAGGPAGAVVATVAVFLPGFLLLLGVLPFWQAVRRSARVRAALTGVNAAVVGLLAAALVDPVTVTAVTSLVEACYAALLFVVLRLTPAPPWAVVLLALAGSPLLAV